MRQHVEQVRLTGGPTGDNNLGGAVASGDSSWERKWRWQLIRVTFFSGWLGLYFIFE